MGLFDFFHAKKTVNSNYNSNVQYNNPYSDIYFADMEKIEAAWSVLNNLRIYQGEQVKQFEELCRRNIEDYKKMNAYDLDINPDYPIPHHAPAYVRLTMLYEKQKKYKEAIDICVEAIKNGAYNDHSKGKMYGRLARLIRKSGIEVNADIVKLTVMQ